TTRPARFPGSLHDALPISWAKPALRVAAPQAPHSVAGCGDPGAETQLRAILQAEPGRVARIEFQHVARGCAARVGRATVAGRARRYVTLLRYQPAVVVEIQDVQGDPRVLHPVRLGF